MTEQDNNIKRKAIKDRIRPKVRQELLTYCNEDGLIVQPLPETLVRRGRKLQLFKVIDLGRPDPNGFQGWWFVRLHTGKQYKPPNLEKYLHSADDTAS